MAWLAPARRSSAFQTQASFGSTLMMSRCRLFTARLREYSRVLDMRAGTLTRSLVWETPAGKHVIVRTRRLVSLAHRHLMAVVCDVVLPEHSAPITISSLVLNRQDVHLRHDPGRGLAADPRRATELRGRVLDAQFVEAQSNRMLLGYKTVNSGMTLGVAVDHVIETSAATQLDVTLNADVGEAVLTADASPGVAIRMIKYISYQSSRSAPPAELVARCGRTLDRAIRAGADALVASQRSELDRFWDTADVVVTSSEGSKWTARIRQAIRWNLFQLCQATWRAEGASVPAKGLTAGAYEGHYFWDTEVYLLPFLCFTQPRIARNLLRFRFSMLDRARSARAGSRRRRRAVPVADDQRRRGVRCVSGRDGSVPHQCRHRVRRTEVPEQQRRRRVPGRGRRRTARRDRADVDGPRLLRR